MKKENAARLAAFWSGLGLAVALMTAPCAVFAQEVKPAMPEVPLAGAKMPALEQDQAGMAEAGEPVYAPLQVGDATQSLFAWQRSGDIASPTARPIAGTVANRSYERYLKSFEFPIPERMSSIVKSSSGSGGGAPK
jgi:hypothetical protein